MTRDPRIDPKPGDVIAFRDKPGRTVIKTFIDACGNVWVDYSITKQMTMHQWKRAAMYAEVRHVSD